MKIKVSAIVVTEVVLAIKKDKNSSFRKLELKAAQLNQQLKQFKQIMKPV